MKLRDEFITQDIDGDQVMISMDHDLFSGIVRSNSTAAYIVDLLGKETTRGDIVKAMLERYDVQEEVVSKDVDDILDKLRSIHALEE